jgi:putative ABC transport system permease protein
MNDAARYLQTFAGLLLPLPVLRAFRGLFGADAKTRSDDATPAEAPVGGSLILAAATVVSWIVIAAGVAAVGIGLLMYLGMWGAQPQSGGKPPELSVKMLLVTGFFIMTMCVSFVLSIFLLGDWPFLNSFKVIRPEYAALESGLQSHLRLVRTVYSLLSTLLVCGLSLLPLSALIVALPAASPNEAVLTESVKPVTTWGRRLLRRASGLFSGLIVLLTLLAISVETVSWLNLPERGRVGAVMEKLLGVAPYRVVDPKAAFADPTPGEKPPKTTFALIGEMTKDERERLQAKGVSNEQIRYLCEPLTQRLPRVMVQHWPFVFLAVYGFDLLLLLAVGKVPLAYNWRNLVVRRVTAGLTAMVFAVVVGLVVVLLAFVNGMYELNENSGVPGNVIVLSDGATDEVFSNLGYGDVDNIPRVVVTEDADGYPLPQPVRIKESTGQDGKPAFVVSREIFFTVNQQIPNPNGGVPKRRFLALRAMDDAKLSGEVHNVSLYPGGSWFGRSGVQAGPDGRQYIQAVIGDGVAAILGEDYGKARLGVGDTFQIGDTDWIVCGIMQAQGQTSGSEIWVQNTTLVTKPFGKDKYTTLVMRTTPETIDAARAMAFHLQYRFDQQKLKTFSEKDYYLELTKTNEDFLFWIIVLAVVMALGGVFGVMMTMFASIAARIKEVGVLQILGFKRWQILISFMLESLTIAFLGGLLGCLLGMLANGFEATSTLGGQGGGGKRVLLQLTVDYQTIAAGMLFTLMMGRIGGLVPALSAMRMKILDTLR